MKRISKQACIVSHAELRHGWTFGRQVDRNPQARTQYPEVRLAKAEALYRKRARRWARRAEQTGLPEYYERAAYSLKRANQCAFKARYGRPSDDD